MTKRSVDEAVAALARCQHGAFSHRQVVAAGGDRWLEHRRTGAGTWLRLSANVFALPGNPPTWERQVKAAELEHRRAVLWTTTAAVLHHLEGFRQGRPRLLIPEACKCSTPLAEVRRSRLWMPGVDVGGFCATDIVRTILDVAPLAADRLGRVLDDAVLAKRLDLAELADALPGVHGRHRRSVELLSPLLDRRLDDSGATESVLEGALLDVLTEAGIHDYALQQRPPWWSSRPQRVDVTLRKQRAIVEADGRRYHARLEAMDTDRARDNQAGLHHWRVFRYTWFQLTRQRADVLAELRILAEQVADSSDHAERKPQRTAHA